MRRPVKFICKQCGKEFWDSHHERRYCSWACYSEARGKPLLVVCDGCSKKYTTHKSRLVWKRHYCSYQCYLNTVRISTSPPKSQRYAYFRNLIAKYNSICVLCKSNEKWKPIMHHLIRKSDGGTDEEENLCCLHRGCHRAVERIYQYDKPFYLDTIVPLLRKRRDEVLKTITTD